MREDFPLLSSFGEEAQRFFSAETFARDFSHPQTLKEINQWVGEKTGGQVKKHSRSIGPGEYFSHSECHIF